MWYCGYIVIDVVHVLVTVQISRLLKSERSKEGEYLEVCQSLIM